MGFDPFDHIIRTRRRRKATRAEIRARNKGKKRIHHGGRGKIYGLKVRKAPKKRRG